MYDTRGKKMEKKWKKGRYIYVGVRNFQGGQRRQFNDPQLQQYIYVCKTQNCMYVLY